MQTSSIAYSLVEVPILRRKRPCLRLLKRTKLTSNFHSDQPLSNIMTELQAREL